MADFFEPPLTVLGASSQSHFSPLGDVYEGVNGRVFETSLAGAEMVKYACNAFLAIKIGFANEFGNSLQSLRSRYAVRQRDFHF